MHKIASGVGCIVQKRNKIGCSIISLLKQNIKNPEIRFPIREPDSRFGKLFPNRESNY